MENKFCQKCGHKLAIDDAFCIYCGTKQHVLDLNQNNNLNNGTSNLDAPYNNGTQYNQNTNANMTNENTYDSTQNHSVGFEDSVKLFWKNAFSFKGCSSRSEYWYSVLFYLIIMILAVVIPFIFYYSTSGSENFIDPILSMAITTMIFDTIAVISLTVRRLHDANLSGGFYWFTCIPYVGWIVLLIFACLPTSPGSVRFGKRDDEVWYHKEYAWVILIIISLTTFVLFLAGDLDS